MSGPEPLADGRQNRYYLLMQQISARDLAELIREGEGSQRRIIEINNFHVIDPGGLSYKTSFRATKPIVFKNIWFESFRFGTLDNANLHFVNCRFNHGDFDQIDNSSIRFAGQITSSHGFRLRNCSNLTVDGHGGGDNGLELHTDSQTMPYVGFVFDSCSDLTVSLMNIKTPFSLQFWRCRIKINNLNNNQFNIFQMRSTSVDMELRLDDSSFEGVELNYIDAPWINVDIKKISQGILCTHLGLKSRSFLELSKMYSKMNQIKESIRCAIEASKCDARFTNDQLKRKFKDAATLGKATLFVRIIANHLHNLFINTALQRFYSPLRVFLLGIFIGLAYSTFYVGRQFWDGVNNKEFVLDQISSIYYSFGSFFTLVYGDVTPLEDIRFIAISEAGLGIIFAAFFSLTVARRYTI